MNETIRQDFPILHRTIYDRPLVYLDNAATTQKPVCVIDRIAQGYAHLNANIHRGVHYLSQQATEAHESARRTAQQFLHARKSEEIIFTRGTTESINLVASSFTCRYMQAGDEIILSAMEHHSNIVPWQIQAARQGIAIKVIPLTASGELNMAEYAQLFSARTRLVAVTHTSNVLGTINPVEDIIQIAHDHHVPVLIDGAQAVAHQPVDVQAIDVDFYTFSSHKIYGPAGIGILYGKEKWLDEMPPYQGGGEMIASVSFENTTFNDLPYKFEAGTPDFIGSTAMAAALDYLTQAIGFPTIAAHEQDLLQYATEKLLAINALRIYGNAKQKSSVLSFLVGDIHPYDMGTLLDKLGIAVRTGHHCAEPLIKSLGITGTVRASFALYNTREEIDLLADSIARVKRMFQTR